MKIAMIGGGGFIGRHISAAAVQQGITPVSIGSGRSVAIAESSCAGSIENFLSGELDNLLSDADSIAYLANRLPTSNHPSISYEIEENVLPLMKVLERLKAIGFSGRFVYFSSGGTIYGRGHSSPIIETAKISPIVTYGLGKAHAEAIIKFYGEAYGLSYAIFRVANPVGIWQKSTRQGLVGVALNQVAKSKPVTIFGDGLNQRDYFSADDLAQAFLLVASRSDLQSDTWNIGSSIGRSERDIIALIEQALGHSIPLVFGPARTTDLRYAVLNTDKIRRDLNWEPSRDMVDVIGEVIESLVISRVTK